MLDILRKLIGAFSPNGIAGVYLVSVLGLLREIKADLPSGENLEYDSVFTEMELAAQPGEERQVGDSILEAEEPDWRDVASKAKAVLEQSHDLRAAVLMANAELRLRGLDGFADAVAYIRGALTDYWATCHPQLDADDDDDPTMRVNAVLALADPATTLRGLRAVPLTASRGFGALSLRDVMVAEGELPPASGSSAVDSGLVSAAVQDTDPEKLSATLAAARAALADVTKIDRTFGEKTPGQGPELDPLIKMLSRIVKFLADATGGDAVEAEAEPDAAEQAPGQPAAEGAPQRGAVAAPGTIASPQDVVATLDKILAYYARHEPSSPLPILLQRAKKLAHADFLTIIRELAPGGVDNVMLIGGLDDK